jgi:predicted  nucleic acid-binding Zn-ribbon protein
MRLDIVIHTSPVDQALLQSITTQLNRVITNQEVLMEDVTSLNAKMDKLTGDIAAERAEVQSMLTDLRTQIQTLTDKLNSGVAVTQADLDALGARMDTADTAVQGISDSTTPA